MLTPSQFVRKVSDGGPADADYGNSGRNGNENDVMSSRGGGGGGGVNGISNGGGGVDVVSFLQRSVEDMTQSKCILEERLKEKEAQVERLQSYIGKREHDEQEHKQEQEDARDDPSHAHAHTRAHRPDPQVIAMCPLHALV